ncbi:phosphatidylinositol-glycan biosynthesis class S protein [Trametes gibbosa]|nr:phosphatidylinositol-glycan biosynthesis class S protein [Trametes gibbosa]
MDSSSRHADPALLCFESSRTRRLIIASYWAVVLLAVPLWWKSTSIERLSLPTSRVHAQRSRELSYAAEVQVQTTSAFEVQSLVKKIQDAPQLDRSALQASALNVQLGIGGNSNSTYNVVLEQGHSEAVVDGRKLRFGLGPAAMDSEKTSPAVSIETLADTLTKLLAPYATHSVTQMQTQRVMKYSPRYRLAFTLLNEDSSSGTAALSWDVQEAIQAHVGPLLEKLSDLHNFTIESQVQFHAPLAFQPRASRHGDEDVHGLSPEDLTVFINSAEWTLSSSVSNDPVIHFVLFIPSAKNSPLHILDNEGLSSNLRRTGIHLSNHGLSGLVHPSNAFLLPQWGGIVLLNPTPDPTSTLNIISRLTSSDLSSVFITFAHQLLTLLGVPGLPHNVRAVYYSDGAVQREPFTDWELDALLRRRARENIQSSTETLEAIVRLVDQIENMPVGQDVVGDVQDAIDALNDAHKSSRISPVTTLKHSARALTLASRAFFNPGMLALLYFPAEHTYAVYAPLFASVSAPLLGAILREFAAWRRARKARKCAGEQSREDDGGRKAHAAKAE